MLEQEQGPQDVRLSHVTQLTEMGFREKAARVALKASGDTVAAALEKLQVCASICVMHLIALRSFWRCVALHHKCKSGKSYERCCYSVVCLCACIPKGLKLLKTCCAAQCVRFVRVRGLHVETFTILTVLTTAQSELHHIVRHMICVAIVLEPTTE